MFFIILRYTFRNLIRNRFYHLISISGLTIAMTCAFFILVWANYELSFDRSYPSVDRLYRLTFEYHSKEHQSHFARSYQEWVLQIPGFFPEVEQMIRLQPMREARVKINENKFYNSRTFCTDSSFFNVFGFELIRGDPDKVLSEPRCVVLTESIAKKYFGNENPVGKEIFTGHQFDTIMNIYRITGIMEDFPASSHFHVDILGSLDDPKQHIGWAYIYLLLHESSDPATMMSKFPDFLKQFMSEEEATDWTPHLQLVKDIHLYSDKDREIEQNGNIQNIYIFLIVAFVLLIVALINYANIQLTMINKKMGFIFLNRVSGARIRDVSGFLAVEAATQNLLAFLLSVLLLIAGKSLFIRIFGYQVDLNHPGQWIQICSLGLILTGLGVFIGSYPIFLLRGKEKLFSLSGRIFYQSEFGLIPAGGKINGRKVMIMLQFLGSVILIMSTLIVFKQVEYMLTGGIGSGQKDILVLKDLPRPVLDNYMVFKRELLMSPLIKEVSASMEEPGSIVMDAMHFEMSGRDEAPADEFINVFPVDNTFLEFYDIPLIAGNNFPEYLGMEANEYYIINQSALNRLGFKSPEDAIGQPFKLIFQWPEIFKGGKIIGVSRDFNFYSMKEPVKPLVMFQKHIWFWCFLVKVDMDNFSEALEYLGKTWDKLYPDFPMQYHFVDDLYAGVYRSEITQSKVLGIFTLLTVIIACLGLIGLVMYSTEIRTKEIGIRKVNGAGLFRILLLLNGEILIWIFIALLLAVPVTWYMMTSWLQNFIYRIDIQFKVFAFGGFVIIFLSLLSTSFQILRAATKNPAESLRYE